MKKFTILAASGVGILLLLGIWGEYRTSRAESQWKNEIVKNLPNGSTAVAAISFFESKGLKYHYAEKSNYISVLRRLQNKSCAPGLRHDREYAIMDRGPYKCKDAEA